MEFPKEHSNHPQYKTEWWYLAGIGELEDTGRTNYHISFFRKTSRSLKKDILFVHFGLNKNGKFEFKEKRAESAFDTTEIPFSGIIGDWNGWELSRFMERYIVVFGRGKGTSFTHIANKKPVVNKNGHYSITNMTVQGAIEGKIFKGKGWFDHEFNDMSGADIAKLNYKWFALQLDIGIELMLYMFPTNPPRSIGRIVFPGRETQEILPGDYCLRDKRDGIGWILEIPKYGMILTMQKQSEAEIKPDLGVGYTEGTVDIISRGKVGQGFFEIAGV